MRSTIVGSYELLHDRNNRRSFFHDLMHDGLETSDAVNFSVHNLVWYIHSTRDALRESGHFDEGEALEMACDSVYGGLREFIDIPVKINACIPRLHGMDQYIRVMHGIDGCVYPLDHPDSMVASFYETFHDLLALNVDNNGYSPDGGYIIK